jgi:TrmH family RNA methyltransferase
MHQDVVAEMARNLERRGTRVVCMSGDVFNRLSDRDGPSGVMAIVRMETTPLEYVEVGADDAWIVLHRVHNPGNLGTIMRTADATGCAGVILTGDSTDPFSPVAVKSSMGSVFAVPIVVEPDFQTVREWARSRQIELVGTSGSATHDHWNREWQRPVGIVLGNEGDGLPDEIMAELDDTVRIPMTGTVESLNLGIAAGVLMYEVQRGLIS